MMKESDPFSSYLLNKPSQQIKNEVPTQNQNDNSENPFTKYALNKSEENESFLSQIPRHAARISSRIAETIGGTPGDIQDLIQSGVFAGLEKLTGHKASPELRKEAAIKSERAPTSSELKELSESSTKGFTKAHGIKEELGDEFASTVASLLGPMKFRKALGISALGVGAKQSLKLLGLGETSQEFGKIGTMIVSSMINPKGVKQLYDNYYNEALRLAPEEARVSAKPLEKSLNSLKKSLSEGLDAPTEEAVLKVVKKATDKIQDGQVSVREMMASNRSLNEIMGDPEFLKRAKNLFPELKNGINKTLQQYENPEFLKNWKSANEAFGGFYESQKLSRFIEQRLGIKPIKHALFTAAGETIVGYPEAIIPTIGLAAGGYAGIKGLELMQRIFANPTLRKYYGEVLTNAAKENSIAMNKAAEKLDKKLRIDFDLEEEKKLNPKHYRKKL